jgi:hypothetical protein
MWMLGDVDDEKPMFVYGVFVFTPLPSKVETGIYPLSVGLSVWN